MKLQTGEYFIKKNFFTETQTCLDFSPSKCGSNIDIDIDIDIDIITKHSYPTLRCAFNLSEKSKPIPYILDPSEDAIIASKRTYTNHQQITTKTVDSDHLVLTRCLSILYPMSLSDCGGRPSLQLHQRIYPLDRLALIYKLLHNQSAPPTYYTVASK